MKYKVTRVIDFYTVKLNIPGRIHPRFYINLLQRLPNNPLPSQRTDDERPPPVLVTDDEGNDKKEYKVERILGSGTRRNRRVILIKWIGYTRPI